MISCLTDYITLQDVGTTTPKSGRYLNEMPGIDTTQFDLIRRSEAYDLESAWNDIERRAIRRFEAKLNTWGAKYFKRYSYLENVVTGQYDSDTTVPSGTQYRGWLFSQWLDTHKNMKLVLQEANLYSDAAVTASIYIINASTGDTLDTVSHSFSANSINRIILNKEYPVWKYPNLFIAYRTADIVSLKMNDMAFNSGFNVSLKQISTGAKVVEDNMSGIDSSGCGLILTYSLGCSWDQFLCQRIQLFEDAYMHLLAAEFCNERLFSDRINQYTLLNREDALGMKDFFMKEFEEMINGVLKAIPVDFGANDACFECSREVNYRHALP